MTGAHVTEATTWLFVPGSRPDRFTRAMECGADQVILDLEDAVPSTGKDQAREHVAAFLESTPAVTVRINGSETPWHTGDLEVVSRFPCAVMVPKAESADSLRTIAAASASGSVIALIETATGVLAAPEIAAASTRIAFGNVDLATELRLNPADRDALAPSRAMLVLAAAANARPAPVDGVTLAINDDAACREEAGAAARHGFTGKLCIHPRQVPAARSGFRPTDSEITWAQQVVAAGGVGAVQVNGEMVDPPVLARAQAILRRL